MVVVSFFHYPRREGSIEAALGEFYQPLGMPNNLLLFPEVVTVFFFLVWVGFIFLKVHLMWSCTCERLSWFLFMLGVLGWGAREEVESLCECCACVWQRAVRVHVSSDCTCTHSVHE